MISRGDHCGRSLAGTVSKKEKKKEKGIVVSKLETLERVHSLPLRASTPV